MPKLDEYVRIAEAAEYLGVHRNTHRNWGHTGKLPEYRHPLNNYRLFKVSDLDKLLKRPLQLRRAQPHVPNPCSQRVHGRESRLQALRETL